MWDKLFIKFLLFFILFTVAASLYSEESNHKTIGVLLSSRASDYPELYSFNEILIYSISFELKRSGFAVINSEDIGSTEELLKEADNQSSSFLIIIRHSAEGGSLEIVLDCFRVSDGKIIFSVSKESEINLGLDSTIKEVALEAIELIEQDIKINPNLLTETEEIAEVLLEKEETLVEDNNIEQNEEAPAVEIVRTSSLVQVTEPVDFRHFTISASFSTFLTTGEATNYFTLGLVPDIYAGYRFFTSYGYLSLGLSTSINYFMAEGILLPSDNLLISLGPEIRWGFDINSFFGMFFRLNGGATLFMMNRNNEGFISTFIPSASGGPGFTMNITPGIGIVTTINYSIYFDNSVLITGFSPSAGVYLRL